MNDEPVSVTRAGVRMPAELCRAGAILPRYAREGDAGMDICAAEDVSILPGQTVLIPTGLKFAVPPGYELQIRPRSGLSLRTALRIPNSPGTVDSGYREEVGIIMTNTCLPGAVRDIGGIRETEENRAGFPERLLDDPPAEGACVYKVRKGDRIAQIVLQATPKMELITVESVLDYGEGRQGGFGSTGVAGEYGEYGGIQNGAGGDDCEP